MYICNFLYFHCILGTSHLLVNFNATQYQSNVKPCTPIGTVVLEAAVAIHSTDRIRHIEFGVIGESINSGDFLINGMTPPVIVQPPFQSTYLLLIVSGSVMNTTNENITFNLYSLVNTTSNRTVAPYATVILQLPGK